MTKEKQFFITALADHLSFRNSNLPENLEWKELFIISEQHQVSGIIYAQCKNPIFQQAYYSSIADYLKRKETIGLIAENLRKNGIDFFLVKGPVIAQHYPVPALRTMGDMDVVVRPEDRERVKALLVSCGFRTVGELGGYEWHFRYGKQLIELHDHLVYDQIGSEDKHKAFFNNCWKYAKDGEVDDDFHFLFLLLHLRKHFINRGVGFRQFIDVAVMEREELNWLWIVKKLRELDLWIFAQRVFALNQIWFGIEPPVTIQMPDSSFADEATDMMLKNGVFGFDNEMNEENVAVNMAKRGTSFLARSRQIVHGVFFPYSALIMMPQYSYLRKSKVLLPFAWVHRAVRAVYLGRADKTLKHILQQAFVSKDVVEQRSKVLEEWGL